MNKAKEISALWKQIKPQIGELARLCHEVESHAEVTADAYQRGYETGYKDGYNEPGKNQQEAYQRGLNDAWECAKKITYMDSIKRKEILRECLIRKIQEIYSASECIEKILQYEQEKEELKEEQSVTAEEIMRQSLDAFCRNTKSCEGCPLNTSDFTCGRGYHFLTKNPISDEEVRRAYAKVLAKMKE